MTTDFQTNTVFFSDLLPKKCPILYNSIDKILSDNGIDHRLLANTKDIWCRDYMPIQQSEKHFVFYKYNPDYLQTPYYKRTITDVNSIGNVDCLRQEKVTNLDLVLDGGNIVKCDDKIIMTKKVFAENKDKKQKDIIRMLEEAFQCDIIFLPWDKEEIFGHSDGIVHFVRNNRVLMTNYADFDPDMARRFLNILKPHVEVIPLTFNVKQRHERSWAYINYLQLENLVLVPQLGIPEDEQALEQIKKVLPKCKVYGVPALEAVRKGGALNCISWNVNTLNWNNGFMGEEYKIYDKTVSQIKKAAEKGLPDWENNLGVCYIYGKGVEKNVAEGNNWYKKAIEHGSTDALFNLGVSYYQGEGVVKDLQEAKRLFEKSSAQGDDIAQLYIGRILEDTNASCDEIVAAYKKAAEMGCAEAQDYLGYWYENGENGLDVDYQEAFRWYKKAAEQGYRYAQYDIGCLYDDGLGVKENKREAVKWFKRAASKNNVDAIYRLGLCYYFANGVGMDRREALKLFRKAAKDNHAGAICMIGDYYYEGCLVEENKEEALKYYEKAAELGSEMAKKSLDKIKHNAEQSEDKNEDSKSEPDFSDVPF
ncbi:MAG: SEL1-like repeat protein [Bacteroidales bacterium]|nr:SEL1-like repeat protein [Bacteroidales bacterium]